MADLIESYRTGEKESGTETGSGGTSPEQEELSVGLSISQRLSSAVQAAHLSYVGLRVPNHQVCRSHTS